MLSAIVGAALLDRVGTVELGTQLSDEGAKGEASGGGLEEQSRSTLGKVLTNTAATFRLMLRPHMAMLIPTLFFLGVDVSFMAGHFTKVGICTCSLKSLHQMLCVVMSKTKFDRSMKKSRDEYSSSYGH